LALRRRLGQHLIGLTNALKALGCLVIIWVSIRVVLSG
jgi:hypothetical protein